MTFQRSSTATRWEPWTYRDLSWMSSDMTGYGIAAIDGEIGKVDDATHDVNNSYLVVDTAAWIFGKKVMLPAGVVSNVDHANRRVFVDRTKEQIKNAPEFKDSFLDDLRYRDQLGTYYGEGPGSYTER